MISTAVATMPAITLSADANFRVGKIKEWEHLCCRDYDPDAGHAKERESSHLQIPTPGEPISFATAIKPGDGNILRAQTALANVPAFSTSSLKFPLRGVPHFSFGATARE